MQEKNNEELGNIQLDMKRTIQKIVIDLLNRSKTKNNFRKDVSTFDMAYLILQIQWGMYDYLELKYSINFRENVKNNKPVFSIPKEDILRDVTSFVKLLKNGMQKTES